MSKTLTLESALSEKRKVEAEASQLHADAVRLREKFIGEGLDLSAKANKDQFNELDAAFKAADEKKSEAQELDVALTRLAEIDGIGTRGPSNYRPTAVGNEDRGPRMWRPGQRLTMSDAYRAAKATGRFDGNVDYSFSAEVVSREELFLAMQGRNGFRATEVTGASSTSAGPFVQNSLEPGYVRYMTKAPRLMNAVGRGTTDSDTVEYVTQSSPTNNSDGVPEGTAAPEAVLPFATATTPVEDYAQFVAVSNRAMADAANIESIIEDELTALLLDNVEDDLASGAGSSNDVEGIYTAVSQTYAVGTAGDGRIESIHRGMTQIRTAAGVYMEADYIGIHPADYEDLILETDGNGNYLMGPPAMAGSRTIWGIPFLVSPVFTSGTPLVGNFERGAKMWIREGIKVTAGLDGSDFTKRRVSLLANMRFAFKTIRITAFSEITGF